MGDERKTSAHCEGLNISNRIPLEEPLSFEASFILKDHTRKQPQMISHYGVTGSMRSSWVRLSLFEELQSRAASGGNRP
jgi:predicted alpha/beta-fold hydrolase